MKIDRQEAIGRTVEVKAVNRPLKIAYLVPFDDSDKTKLNIDAVFFESYTRWAGVYTLIIPTDSNKFLADEYESWLKFYDPDFIYTYVDLEADFVERIDRLCCPIAFISCGEINQEDKNYSWRSFLPDMGAYVTPVSSISTIKSPASYSKFNNQEPTIFTQFGLDPRSRFLADNFGTGFDVHNILNPIPGLFNTLCLVPPNIPDYIMVGTERCHSTLEAFESISNRKTMPIALLAMANSSGIIRPESRDWSSAFQIFIGNSSLDRINFWNSRHIGRGWGDLSNSLVLELELFDDENFLKQLGQYLNNHNFSGNGNGPYLAEIRSSSIQPDVLTAIKEKIAPHTHNMIRVSLSCASLAFPTLQELVERSFSQSTDAQTLKLNEKSSEVRANEPAHFIYTPPQLSSINRGQWIVELEIQRHNNLSKYSNVIDTWKLPQCRRLARVFTSRLAKPTLGGRLALLPSIKQLNFGNRGAKSPSTYDINLPSDEVFFRSLILEGYFVYPADDLRGALPKQGYTDLGVSDKGQNLRGVISLFDNLETAFDILTNSYWRAVLAQAKTDSATPLTFDLNKLYSLIPNDREVISNLTKEIGLANVGKTKEYLRDGLKDALEYLIRLNVFYQVAHWPCEYCGHMNSRSFDNMKIKNECDICKSEYLAPIDVDWKYELSTFVHRSLQKHSGLPVLWALGFLHGRSSAGNFWYLPEVNLYEGENDKENQNEIDILCVVDGIFHAVEAKRSVSMFVNKPESIDKFVKVIRLLRPNIAILAFERYCANDEDVDQIKVKLAEAEKIICERVGPWTKLKVIVAQDEAAFEDFSGDFGWNGPRIRKYW